MRFLKYNLVFFFLHSLRPALLLFIFLPTPCHRNFVLVINGIGVTKKLKIPHSGKAFPRVDNNSHSNIQGKPRSANPGLLALPAALFSL